MNICAAFLDSGSISSPEAEEGDATDDLPSSTSSTTSTSNTSAELALNTTALDAIVLEPVGGVTAAGGYLFVENVSLFLLLSVLLLLILLLLLSLLLLLLLFKADSL